MNINNKNSNVMKYKIAVITPKNKNDYLTETVLDGLLCIKKQNNDLDFKLPKKYPSIVDVYSHTLPDMDFVDYALKSDLIIFMWGKDNTDYELADRINHFEKTVYIDGSEIGKNGRYDLNIQNAILDGTYEGRGKIDLVMENKCALYFRREKPYIRNIIPFPFGIESKYLKYFDQRIKKDIDFFCVFGQDEYPLLRRECGEVLVKFCRENNFNCFVQKTDKDNFYKTLSRSKVGISVGGGGYDTARFWEILGNNCILITENIDIYNQGSDALNFKRIYQFKDIQEFEARLKDLGNFLLNSYDQSTMVDEYVDILEKHSSKSRVIEIIEKAKEKGIII